MLPLPRKSNVENEGKVDFHTHIEERKCHFHFDALQIEVTGYWCSSGENKLHHFRRFPQIIHRSRVHWLQRKIPLRSPAFGVRHEEAVYEKNFKVSLRRRLAAKTRLATQISEKIKLTLHKSWKEVKLPLITTTSIFNNVLDDHLLEEKNISTLKKLLNWHQLHYLRKVNSCSKNVALMRRYLRKKFIRVESTHFFWTKTEAMDSSKSFFNRRTSAKRKWQCCFLSRGLCDLEDKRRSENIAFPFIVKSLPGYREARRIISIILWQSTLLVGEEHFLHFFYDKRRLQN